MTSRTVAVSAWYIDLPYTRPPLSLNDRMHWRKKATITKAIREHVAIHAWQFMDTVPEGTNLVRVVLHYVPRDKRRRDTDNLVLTLKPCKDGLVDAGLCPDDTPDHMDAPMPVIDPPDSSNPRLYLVITFHQKESA